VVEVLKPPVGVIGKKRWTQILSVLVHGVHVVFPPVEHQLGSGGVKKLQLALKNIGILPPFLESGVRGGASRNIGKIPVKLLTSNSRMRNVLSLPNFSGIVPESWLQDRRRMVISVLSNEETGPVKKLFDRSTV